jgi:hypothetical protein
VTMLKECRDDLTKGCYRRDRDEPKVVLDVAMGGTGRKEPWLNRPEASGPTREPGVPRSNGGMTGQGCRVHRDQADCDRLAVKRRCEHGGRSD